MAKPSQGSDSGHTMSGAESAKATVCGRGAEGSPVKEPTKKVELLTRENQMCEKQITYLQNKLKEKENDRDNKTNS